MPNANKNRGDRYERFVLAAAHAAGFIGARRTRAGYERDSSDIHLVRTRSGPEIVVQVKDVVTPNWREWLEQTAAQEAEAGAKWSFIVWKRRGTGTRPALHLAVMPLDRMLDLYRAAGYGIEDESETKR